MKVNIKNGFDLGAFHYKVEVGKWFDNDLLARDRYGEHSEQLRKVTVSTCYNPTQFNVTFLHEVVEAVNSLCCANSLDHNHIEAIGHGLGQIFKSLGIEFVYEEDVD